MIEIFGVSMPEGLFYTLCIAGTIFYVFMVWFILQLMRRKMPIRISKLGLGQALEEYRGREDDVKVYWREGFRGRPHEATKTSKERIKTHWGVPNKLYLVRRDFNLTIPFAKRIITEGLKLLHLTDNDIKLIKEKKDNPNKPFPVQELSKQAKNQIQVFETQNLELCDSCKGKLPEYLTVDFLTTDELKGSSTEATSQRRNEDFVNIASQALKRIARGDFLMNLLFGVSIGSIFTIIILIITGVLTLG